MSPMNAGSPEDVHSNGKEPVQRLTQHTKDLVEDVKSWLDLKVRVTIMEVRTDIENWIRGFAYDGAALAIFALGLLFGLVALSLGVGTWLGHPAWGFASVMGLLWFVALVLRLVGRRYKKDNLPMSNGAALPEANPGRQLPAGSQQVRSTDKKE